MGHAVPDVDERFLAIRVWRRFKHYLIFYHLMDDEAVEIVRVFHGARNIPALL